MGKGVSAGFLIAGIGVGAGCMYLMDPNRGRPRRVLLRDKTEAAYRRVRTSVASAQSDFANREHGLIANVKSTVQRGSVDDERLVERVRAKLGRLVSHPHAIDVIARNGRITVSGAVLEHEAAQLLFLEWVQSTVFHPSVIISSATVMLPMFPVCKAVGSATPRGRSFCEMAGRPRYGC